MKGFQGFHYLHSIIQNPVIKLYLVERELGNSISILDEDTQVKCGFSIVIGKGGTDIGRQ